MKAPSYSDDARYGTTLAGEEVLQLRRILDWKDARIAELEQELDGTNAVVMDLQSALSEEYGPRWEQVKRESMDVVLRLRRPDDGLRELMAWSPHPCYTRRTVAADHLDAFLDFVDGVTDRLVIER